MTDETFYTMALTRLSGFNAAQVKLLYDEMGGAKAIYDNRQHLNEVLADCTPRLIQALSHWDEALQRAEEEKQFLERNQLRILTPSDHDYPQRLLQCPDAPLTLYYRGTADLNQSHILSVVGTRRCTPYGRDLVNRFMAELKSLCPQVLIVSGLAYGIDICAHRAALNQGYDTVAVMAHGQDKLYPPRHIDTARDMVKHGGLITEYMSRTALDKLNFVRRNRIVAGMADVTLVVESALHGGSLITAGIARDYNRDIVAFPGNVGAVASEGCNKLIRNQQAQLITSAEDFVAIMGWQTNADKAKQRRQGIERDLFPELSPEQQLIITALKLQNDQQLNHLSVKTNLPTQIVTAQLFELEMKGIVRPMAGGNFHLIDI